MIEILPYAKLNPYEMRQNLHQNLTQKLILQKSISVKINLFKVLWEASTHKITLPFENVVTGVHTIN